MDLEERFQQWLNNHGFQGSVTFIVAFFFLQFIFYAVIVISLVLAFRS